MRPPRERGLKRMRWRQAARGLPEQVGQTTATWIELLNWPPRLQIWDLRINSPGRSGPKHWNRFSWLLSELSAGGSIIHGAARGSLAKYPNAWHGWEPRSWSGYFLSIRCCEVHYVGELPAMVGIRAGLSAFGTFRAGPCIADGVVGT
jgi:hypothetical protein